MDERALLRLHVEAVWGVRLPTLIGNEIELCSDSPHPVWSLYRGELASECIDIWRRDLDYTTRASLRAKLETAIASLPATVAMPGISREVVLQQVATPSMEMSEARKIAQAISPGERALFTGFEDGADYFARPGRGPLFGVIKDGRLLSIAHSSCRIKKACELGLETIEEARRQGYALAATLLWTEAVRQEGLIPIYSALAENTASLKLAEAAGYRAFAYGAHIKSSRSNG